MGFLSNLRAAVTSQKGTLRTDTSHKHDGQVGVESGKHLTYRNWNIEIGRRITGITIKREQFSATLTANYPPFHHFISGSISEKSAIESAQKYIDSWHVKNGFMLSQEELDAVRRKRAKQKISNLRKNGQRS